MAEPNSESKPKLLVIELWGLGDLVIATPFLRAASEKFAVTLLAKPYAQDLRSRFWPEVKVVPFVAPWTAFRRKYYLHRWPWREILRLGKLRREHFVAGLSARWDPRDHVLLRFTRASMRLGFPRLHSQWFLTHPLARPAAGEHRYESWRLAAEALGIHLPPRESLPVPERPRPRSILIHTGAAQQVRVWPLERYGSLVRRLRRQLFQVQVACDPDQRAWWTEAGETTVAVPRNVSELLALMDRAGVFIGNDSGPAHLAALSGLPTFTIFGPQLPEWFAPLHPEGEWCEGKACPFKPCSDYCRFEVPHCIVNLSEEEVWQRVAAFTQRVLGHPAPASPAAPSSPCLA
jgi:ADP-heptose:LPS heptosyltransferase